MLMALCAYSSESKIHAMSSRLINEYVTGACVWIWIFFYLIEIDEFYNRATHQEFDFDFLKPFIMIQHVYCSLLFSFWSCFAGLFYGSFVCKSWDFYAREYWKLLFCTLSVSIDKLNRISTAHQKDGNKLLVSSLTLCMTRAHHNAICSFDNAEKSISINRCCYTNSFIKYWKATMTNKKRARESARSKIMLSYETQSNK